MPENDNSTSAQSDPQVLEARALRWSAAAYLGEGVLGIGFAVVTGSEAILLDGAYSLISFVMTLIALRVAGLVEIPQTERFHFGFAHFEPLLNVVRMLLVLAIALIALISAINAVLSGGRPLAAGWAVVYGIASATLCSVMAFWQRRRAGRIGSPILEADARNWFVDGLLSAAVAAAFLFAFLIRGTALDGWGPYVDPILVIVLLAFALPVPLRTFRENLRQVLMAAPPTAEQKAIHARVLQALDEIAPTLIHVRMLPVGRFLYLMVHVVMPADHRIESLAELDRIRRRVEESVAGLHARPVLDVLFTADAQLLGLTQIGDAK